MWRKAESAVARMLEARKYACVKSQLTLKGDIRSTAKMQSMMSSGATDLKEMPRLIPSF